VADRQLIELLTRDGRESNRSLARKVGLTEATVASRLRHLADRALLGVTAICDWRAAGYEWDEYLTVRVEGRPVTDVAREIAELTYVHTVMVVLGGADLLVHALFPTRSELVEFASASVRMIAGVRRVTSHVTLETLKYEVHWARIPREREQLVLPAPVIDLDPLDHQVIHALVADGRQSNREIARQLGVSDGTVRMRIRRMEEAGLFRLCGQSDPLLTGVIHAWACVAVQLTNVSTRAVAAALAEIPEAVIVALTAGPYDVLMFLATSSRGRLVDLAVDQVRTIPGVRSAETWEIVRTVKFNYQWGRLVEPPPTLSGASTPARAE
jgi:DNA-binding Lrp family transcriptional regulator